MHTLCGSFLASLFSTSREAWGFVRGRSVILAFASTGGMCVPEWLWLGKSWSSGKWDSLYSVLPSASRCRGHPIPKAHAQMSYIAVIPHTRMLFFFF